MTPAAYPTIEELTPAHWMSGFVDANGLRQHFTRTGGDKPPLLLLHGFQLYGMVWVRVARALEGEFDIIMPDARGHGYTRVTESGYSTTAMVEDSAALIAALGLGKPYIIGHSMGADVAARLAAAYPQRVGAAVLVDPTLQVVNPGAWMESEGYQAWYREWLAYVEQLRTQSHEARIEATIARQTPGITPTEAAEFVTHIEALRLLDLTILDHVKTMNAGIPPLKEVVPQIQTPLLVMLAQRPAGGFARVDRANERAELVQGGFKGEVMIFEESGHFIHSDHQDRFLDAVRRFFATARDG